MKKLLGTLISISLTLACTQAFSFTKIPGYLVFEAGAYSSHQGSSQNVYINGLIGDRFNVTDQHDNNAVVGIGYLINGFKNSQFGIDYGINIFSLSPTHVSGNIVQEFAFTNLAYTYYVSHIPVYATAKALIDTKYDKLTITVDAGVGPNFLKTSDYRDSSLDGGITLPDNAFMGHTSVVLSAMAGVGAKVKLTQQVSLELGYRYFYLGQGYLKPRSNQILNNLKTGTNYAQALIFTLSV